MEDYRRSTDTIDTDAIFIDTNKNQSEVDGKIPMKRCRRSNYDIGLTCPLSPSSSSQNSDATFEPTVDMMVNDFDDEQTLNEEEALEELEPSNIDEIDTLKEESEMPLHELLARYGSVPLGIIDQTKKADRKPEDESKSDVAANMQHKDDTGDIVKTNDQCVADKLTNNVNNQQSFSDVHQSTSKIYHSHLLELYPDLKLSRDLNYSKPDAVSNDDEEANRNDEVCVIKTIMIGNAYQATIPVGLSQYGDVLPYENEDKLIWEPSQVSEREVEEYLIKARDIRPNLMDDFNAEGSTIDEELGSSAINEICDQRKETACRPEHSETLGDCIGKEVQSAISNEEGDNGGLVKDNEQALHLLVQCGYDFKEALRRKRLHAVPHTGSMSLWSEEECQKFEEGIQKFGKDFLKIRQQQVRTRTMRELVQFYYLWKKSERRDRFFANSDTVDHMDIYLDEGGDYNTNTTVPSVSGPQITQCAETALRKAGNLKKPISIMTNNCKNVQTNPVKKYSNRTHCASSADSEDSVNTKNEE